MEKNRLEAFSDGVFAIVITLIVLNLKAPALKGDFEFQATELSGALYGMWPEFRSWVISFAVIAIFWVNHHRLISQLVEIDNTLLWLNSLYLLFVSFIPFPTELIGKYPHQPLGVALFGMVLALASFSAFLMRWYAIEHKRLIKKQFSPLILRRYNRMALLISTLPYTIAAVLAFYWITGAIIIYCLVPIYFIFPQNVMPK